MVVPSGLAIVTTCRALATRVFATGMMSPPGIGLEFLLCLEDTPGREQFAPSGATRGYVAGSDG